VAVCSVLAQAHQPKPARHLKSRTCDVSVWKWLQMSAICERATLLHVWQNLYEKRWLIWKNFPLRSLWCPFINTLHIPWVPMNNISRFSCGDQRKGEMLPTCLVVSHIWIGCQRSRAQPTLWIGCQRSRAQPKRLFEPKLEPCQSSPTWANLVLGLTLNCNWCWGSILRIMHLKYNILQPSPFWNPHQNVK